MYQMEEKQFNELISKMNTIIRLLMTNSLKDMKKQSDKIVFLSSLGLGPSDIADLLGTTANTVSVTLSKSKRKNKLEQGMKQENDA